MSVIQGVPVKLLYWCVVVFMSGNFGGHTTGPSRPNHQFLVPTTHQLLLYHHRNNKKNEYYPTPKNQIKITNRASILNYINQPSETCHPGRAIVIFYLFKRVPCKPRYPTTLGCERSDLGVSVCRKSSNGVPYHRSGP